MVMGGCEVVETWKGVHGVFHLYLSLTDSSKSSQGCWFVQTYLTASEATIKSSTENIRSFDEKFEKDE